jgi:uncharacterized protein involved in response to NO
MLLYQGFVLCLVLGVGAFLLPRILQLPSSVELPDTRELSPAWKCRAAFAAGVGVMLLASFFIEVFALAPRVAGVMRFLAAGAFLAVEIPAHLGATGAAGVTRGIRLALVFLLLGLFFPVFWPWQRVAGLHLVFIGGFTLMAFAVATRVVLGHSGHSSLLSRPVVSLQGAALLLVVAAVFRVIGDFDLVARGHLLSVASYLWMIAAALWGWAVLPKVQIAEPET